MQSVIFSTQTTRMLLGGLSLSPALGLHAQAEEISSTQKLRVGYYAYTGFNMIDADGSYSGYWAFEAGAIAYLFNIDDSQIDHMVYPKDLVAYARSNTPKHNTPGPIQAGLSCPHTGYWFSPAQHNSRRYFTQGEIMPEFKGSPWGATIWYWSSAT